jgi:O-antigen/teichoic acid export membrane protein
VLRFGFAICGAAALLAYVWRTDVGTGEPHTVILAALLLFAGGLRMPLALFRARLDMRKELWMILAARLCNFLGFLLLMALSAPGWPFFAATLVSRLLLAGMGWRWANQPRLVNFRPERRRVGLLFVRSLPMAISGVFVAVQLKVDVLLLAHLVDREAAGLFGVVAQLPEYSLAIPVIISTPLLPVIAQAFHRGDSAAFGFHYQRMFDAVLVLGTPFAVLAAAMPRQAVTLLFGGNFSGAQAYLPLLMVATILMWISHVTAVAAVASGLQRHFIWIQIICVVLYLALDWLLIPRYGAMAAAWVRVLTTAIAPVLTYAVVFRQAGAGLTANTAVRTAAIGGGMMLVVHWCSGHSTALAVGAGAVFYCGANWLCWHPRPAVAETGG